MGGGGGSNSHQPAGSTPQVVKHPPETEAWNRRGAGGWAGPGGQPWSRQRRGGEGVMASWGSVGDAHAPGH